MAFEFRDILPAVGAVLGYGVAGPGGAAAGSGIGSLIRGDEMEEAAKNAALGYVGGSGVKYLGGTETGKDFLGGIPFIGDFLQKGGAKSIGDLIPVFQKTSSADRLANLQGSEEFISLQQQYNEATDPIIKNSLGKRMESLVDTALDPKDINLLGGDNLKTLAMITAFGGYGLDQYDRSKGVNLDDYKVTTDTVLEGFDAPTKIRNVSGFAEGGIVSLADGGFPRKNGKIEGPGTETSDDIPAMLSDGEFVVNARTVRGLGESMGAKDDSDARERGSSFLYSLQDKYGGKA